MSRRRIFDSFKLRGLGFVENFALKARSGPPTLLNRAGQLWYHLLAKAPYVSVEDDGEIMPRKLITNAPRWINITTPMIAGTTSVTGNPTWQGICWGYVRVGVFWDEFANGAMYVYLAP